jgi:hypothetical protein
MMVYTKLLHDIKSKAAQIRRISMSRRHVHIKLRPKDLLFLPAMGSMLPLLVLTASLGYGVCVFITALGWISRAKPKKRIK